MRATFSVDGDAHLFQHTKIALQRAHRDAKLLGQLGIRDLNITQNLLISEDYLRLRHALVKALLPFPEAALAVSRVLREAEAVDTGDMSAPVVIDHKPNGGADAHAG